MLPLRWRLFYRLLRFFISLNILNGKLGRTKKSSGGVYSDRLIDIDILLYDQLIWNTYS